MPGRRSRAPGPLAEQPGAIRLVFRHLGPLTRSGAAELTTALPAIGLLGEDERDQVYRLTAGHPLAMAYAIVASPSMPGARRISLGSPAQRGRW